MHESERDEEWLDEVLNCLADRPRRRILSELVAAGEWDGVRVATLAERIEGTSTVHLDHVHLPKLDEADLVSWSQAEETVHPGPRLDEVEPLLAAVEDAEER